MDALAIIAIVLAVIGIIGCIVPALPGPPISWAGYLCLYFSGTVAEPVSLTTVMLWLIPTVIITVLDYILPGIFTKKFGGHKAAMWGATIGLIVGIFFTPIGMLAGSFFGAFIGEKLVSKQPAGASFKAAAGSFIAFILTTGMKLVFCIILLWRICGRLW